MQNKTVGGEQMSPSRLEPFRTPKSQSITLENFEVLYSLGTEEP
jgi:hypothetical protein